MFGVCAVFRIERYWLPAREYEHIHLIDQTNFPTKLINEMSIGIHYHDGMYNAWHDWHSSGWFWHAFV